MRFPYADALNMNYYKKTSYTGWIGGMRFLLKKEEIKEGEETVDTVFHAWVWPGPYIFSETPDEKKTDATFPFEEAGRIAAVDWINEQFETRSSEWPKKKVDTTIL